MLSNELDFFTTLPLPLMLLGVFLIFSLFFGFFVIIRFILRLMKHSGSRVTIIEKTPSPLPPNEGKSSGKAEAQEISDVMEVPQKTRGQKMPFIILLICILLLLWHFVFS